MAKAELIEKVAELSAPKAGRPKRELLTTIEIQRTCKDCGVAYTAAQNTYKDGTVVITPPRCKTCQTVHVTNGRVNKVILGFKHIGNIKARLTAAERDAIVDVLANELKVLMDVFAGTNVSIGGFNLKNV